MGQVHLHRAGQVPVDEQLYGLGPPLAWKGLEGVRRLNIAVVGEVPGEGLQVTCAPGPLKEQRVDELARAGLSLGNELVQEGRIPVQLGR